MEDDPEISKNGISDSPITCMQLGGYEQKKKKNQENAYIALVKSISL